ncbi:DUF2304 domain-containing protein [Ectobacillus polymachus]|uniref:DUF2304 domain-containing protein n=1 Tax=Ectobacillus polymachus TaxID=1508806 RepID=UPI003A84B194
MNGILQIFVFVCALVFSFVVIRLLLKNRISERNSVIWLGGAIAILLISGNAAFVDHAARWLGIDYPPTLLFLLSTLVLLLFSLYQTIQITKLSSKIKDISQYLALHPIDEKQDAQVGKEHE